jgi:hypothetical protein
MRKRSILSTKRTRTSELTSNDKTRKRIWIEKRNKWYKRKNMWNDNDDDDETKLSKKKEIEKKIKKWRRKRRKKKCFNYVSIVIMRCFKNEMRFFIFENLRRMFFVSRLNITRFSLIFINFFTRLEIWYCECCWKNVNLNDKKKRENHC